MTFEYDLTIGLPHTNYGGLADHLLLMQAGYFQWASIAQAIGSPLSSLRTAKGGEVYATFYFTEVRFPEGRSIRTFRLDDRLRFAVWLRSFKNIAVEGRILFDLERRLDRALPTLDGPFPVDGVEHPFIRFGNIFITPEDDSNRQLRVAPPATADFSRIPPLPNDENPYHLTKAAELDGHLGLLGDEWTPIDDSPAFEVPYAVDLDRDTNGAVLVYFANYVAFMDAAERQAMQHNAKGRFSEADVRGRALMARRTAYYGNASVRDTLLTTVSLLARADDAGRLGLRYAIRRAGDGRLICRSEAIKTLTAE